MNRRNSRLRMEFKQRALQQTSNNDAYEARQELQNALTGVAALPSHMQKDAVSLNTKSKYDGVDSPTLEDEYSHVTVPKILLTTSREPSPRLKLFSKELKIVFANTQRVNRGQTTINQLVNSARAADFSDIIILHETRGRPDGMVVSHLPHGPTVYFNLNQIQLRSEVGGDNQPEKAPQLVFEGMESKIGKRITQVMKHLFDQAKPESERAVSFVNRSDCVVFRQHVFERVGKEVLLKEIGPRFNMNPYRIQVDAIDAKAPDVEWQLNTFSSASFKQQIL
ncbi:U3 small nucleolar ribonucleoprotein IMP4 [Spironucleus salmonicida]|uniref:U3 small nucleolar ribonucleoprotein IMP4 n=1 Tax=Spironucleus salmonicida TaxID=348837 RepID=V6LGA5_9EUKA|nr:U3 small nucleolar ribonucleoprotein IMP4 [Spironucleus salmonicida]|eukprot:EST43557.1 U3 small nucleolar ribonucleoprotein IMP4 [Spironucleus salmonicida]